MGLHLQPAKFVVALRHHLGAPNPILTKTDLAQLAARLVKNMEPCLAVPLCPDAIKEL